MYILSFEFLNNCLSFLIENALFSNVLGIVILIGIVEFVATMTSGHSFSHLLDNDSDIDLPGISWLNSWKMPFLMLLMSMLTIFGCTGLIIQAFSKALFNGYIGFGIVPIISFIIMLPLVRKSSLFYLKIFGKEESRLVSRNSFIGMPVTITVGCASIDRPAEAKLKDINGDTHYVMVRPNMEESLFCSKDSNLFIIGKEKEMESVYIIEKVEI